jgi:pimeloyl-ACP methyl ester carboxylesterase
MRKILSVVVALAAAAIVPVRGDDSDRLLTIDHYVRVRSTVPAMAGQPAQVYVRERVLAGAALRGSVPSDRVVLFVHGAGTPAEVAFDVPYQDYSWMGFLARAGYDVFSVDMTGYGRSTRPAAMTDPCNLAADRQTGFTPAPCKPSYAHAMTTIESDWNDIEAAVEYIRQLRRIDRVSLVAWSLGGPRAGGYALRHPQKVNKLVLLAPAYNRTSAAAAPAKPADGVVFNTQSRAEFEANWERQLGCPGQMDAAVSDAVWADMLASDPVGATWGPGVRRAPQTASWGWNAAAVARSQTPTLMIAAVHDRQVSADRVRELHADLGTPHKVLIDLGCSSHNAMWEKNHLLMFRASLEWLDKGTVNGAKDGVVKIGY